MIVVGSDPIGGLKVQQSLGVVPIGGGTGGLGTMVSTGGCIGGLATSDVGSAPKGGVYNGGVSGAGSAPRGGAYNGGAGTAPIGGLIS
jgi:hypothetical protein